FSVSQPGSVALHPRVALPTEGRPGDLLRLEVDAGSVMTSASASLSNSGGRVMTRAAGFRFSGSAGAERWAALLGIPAGLEPGDYMLRLTARADASTYLVLTAFTVQPRDFKNETIALTQQLTSLRTAPDPRKTAEANHLEAIVTTPHADALYDPLSFVLPLTGTHRSSGYGDRRTYEYSGAGDEVSIHEGVDIAAPSGSPIVACGRGRVIFAGSFLMTGWTVVIEHLPGLFSLYFHMSALEVRQGQEVETGQEIGKVGMTGFATGPHLHWEVESLGVSVDPDLLVGSPLLPAPAGSAP
ncbi:MAG TPA: M23 family metallopeptidase, partial [Spirochaetia bacterium]|nr:M23 family metallopeptidase [Spirochaetia bacterium]